MDRYQELRELLLTAKYFKLVCGAGNENKEEVRRLSIIYTLAGCNGFDVSATPEVVLACLQGIEQAFELAPKLRKKIERKPFITVSVGMSGDHHVRKANIVDDCVECGLCIPACPTDAIPDNYKIIRELCIGCGDCEAACPPKIAAIRYEHDEKLLEEILPSCIESGAENIELHAAIPDDDMIMKEWEIVSKCQPNNFISMCLDRFHLSNYGLIKRIKQAKEIAGDRLIIQADGVPMSGGTDDFNTTLQAISIADIINKDLIQQEKDFRHLPILLSGGTNSKTGEMARLCNIPYSGISIGTHARKIVKQYLENDSFDSDYNSLEKAVTVAEELIYRNIGQ